MVAIGIVLREKSAEVACSGQRAASKVDRCGREELAGEVDFASRVHRDPVAGDRVKHGGAPEPLAPEMMAISIELGEERVGPVGAGERATAEVDDVVEST